ncbi:hypothetical protein BD410DRAFT_160569 [Rickenella mellea]|uniref:DUF6534 domain-containing protein n=1 Tax=Rickenella mellea TaxID=50990 RepID=A0A4Y7Q7P0_9AGAM|nr:hypothetical protein BD410DRAFT_160569 [Rickenella mellea]
MVVPIGGFSALELNFWGHVGATPLLGVSMFQGYIFFTNYNDSFRLRLFVGCLMLLDFSTTLFNSLSQRTIIITNSGNPATLTGAKSTLAAEAAATLVVTWLTQIFFAFRVHQVSPTRRVILVLIVFFASLAIAVGMVQTYFVAALPFQELRTLKFKVVNTCAGVFAALSDALAVSAMCMTFVQSKMDTKRFQSVLRYLFIYTVNRGIIVTSAQILAVVLYVYAPTNFYWTPVHNLLSKLYLNTLLAMLNSRGTLRSKLFGETEVAPHNAAQCFPDRSMDVASGETRSTMHWRSAPSEGDISAQPRGIDCEP